MEMETAKTNKRAAIAFAALSCFGTLCWFFTGGAVENALNGVVTLLFCAVSIILINLAHALNSK